MASGTDSGETQATNACQRICHELHPVIWSVFPGAVIASSGLNSWSCCGRGCMLESLVALTDCLEPRLHADRVLGVTEN